jgi:hypothetical protein
MCEWLAVPELSKSNQADVVNLGIDLAQPEATISQPFAFGEMPLRRRRYRENEPA